jgi:hypothetical protein
MQIFTSGTLSSMRQNSRNFPVNNRVVMKSQMVFLQPEAA